MSSHHDSFFDELGHSTYRNLLRAIPDAYVRFSPGSKVEIGDFTFTHLETSTCGQAIYSGKASFKNNLKTISFSFQLIPGDSYLYSVYYTEEIEKPTESKQCRCDSYDFFHFGCRCGALPNYSLKK